MSDEVKIGDRFECHGDDSTWEVVALGKFPAGYECGGARSKFPSREIDDCMIFGGRVNEQIVQPWPSAWLMEWTKDRSWRRLPREQPTVPREAKSWADLRPGMHVQFQAPGQGPADSRVVVHASKHGGIWRSQRGEEYAPRGDLFSAGVVTILADPGQSAPQPAPAIDPWAQRHDFTDPYADQVIPTWTDGVLIKTRIRQCSTCGTTDVTTGAACQGPTDWRRSRDADARDRMRARDDLHGNKRDERPAIETVPYRHSHVGGWDRKERR